MVTNPSQIISMIMLLMNQGGVMKFHNLRICLMNKWQQIQAIQHLLRPVYMTSAMKCQAPEVDSLLSQRDKILSL